MTPGTLLGHRYRLAARLGRGSTAEVWRAHDQLLDRDVAVKLPSTQMAADPAVVGRLRAEAQAAARLHHPNVVAVHDVGEVSRPQGLPLPYVVLELVEGRPLSEALRGGPLPWPAAAQICAQVAAGLAAIHQRGIVHRDVKPGNVMLTEQGAKLVDFGISASVGELDTSPGGELLCTPAYLAPERLAKGPVRAACDVYALGLLLYKTLTGTLPWRWEGMTQLLQAHQHDPPATLDGVPGLPPEVADLYQRCLAKLPADRPTSTEAAGILAAAAARAGHALPAPLGPAPTGLPEQRRIVARETAPTAAIRPGTRPPRRSRRRTRRALAAAGLLLAAAVPGIRPLLLEQPAAEPATTAGCQVAYHVRQDVGGRFAARITLTNTGSEPVPEWRLAFTFPADQRLVGSSAGGWLQSGRSVTVEAANRTLALPAGGSAELELQGDYQDTNPLPTGFRLNGTDCAQLLTAAGAGTGPAPGEAGSRGGTVGSSRSGNEQPAEGGPPEDRGRGHGQQNRHGHGDDEDDKDEDDD
jgi:serine/threonine-protein kinase